jgi:hypothetical protein
MSRYAWMNYCCVEKKEKKKKEQEKEKGNAIRR